MGGEGDSYLCRIIGGTRSRTSSAPHKAKALRELYQPELFHEPGKSEKTIDNSGLAARNEKQNGQDLLTTSGEYKMPLVWIDMEMTGLNTEVDRILEIDCIITDGNLTKSVEIRRKPL